ncbi:hypothetical protein J437_LFUL006585 [Ladona fulva]|uniref:Uncharacterized protein n=1 Tax=Ladona fulva TaxID=123851 RepID=A0A8K0K3Y9_LADFU|nr:hypothetical protein J437_LFUL006585 [Ladona fulva]
MLKAVLGKEDIGLDRLKRGLYRFLLTYRNTAHATTGFTPADLLIGRQSQIPLDSVSTRPNVEKSQEKQTNPKNEVRSFDSGNTIWARDCYSQHSKWASGPVLYRTAPLTFQVKVGDKL